MSYKTIFTTYGKARIAQATAMGAAIALTTMAVGDGNGNPVTPVEGQTSLVREIDRRPINRVYNEDPANLSRFTAELVLPASVGGFTVREVGLFDDTGALFAVANVPEFYKPVPTDGAFGDAVVRLQFIVANAEVIVLQVDPNVAIATHSWVLNAVTPAVIFPGGTTGQILRKRTNADGETEWADPTAVNVTVDCIEETQTLAAGQTVVNLAATTTLGLAVYIEGVRLRSDQWDPDPAMPNTRIVLAQSFPAGTKLVAAQNEPNSGLDLSAYVKRTGGATSAMSGPLVMGGNKVTGVAAGALDGDAIAIGQPGARVADMVATGHISILDRTGARIGTYSAGSAGGAIQLTYGAAPANQKHWDFYVNTDSLVARMVNDGWDNAREWMIVRRSGITSASVRFNASVGIGKDPLAGYSLDTSSTVRVSSQASRNILTEAGQLVVRSGDVEGAVNAWAFISFDRPGIYSASLGIGPDNRLRWGGLTAGGVAHEVWHNGSLPESDLSKYRGSVSAGAGLDGATGNGFYNVDQGGYTGSMLTWNSGGSTGPVQLYADYLGRLNWRNRTDSAVWTAWKAIYHSGNFNPDNYTQRSEFGASAVSENGYQRLPSGLILQWGSVYVGNLSVGGTSVAVTFPIQFPIAVRQIVVGTRENNGVRTSFASWRNPSWTGFTADLNEAFGSSTEFAYVTYFAIGH